MDDWQLLAEYVNRESEDAFRGLVDRYAGMVYHAALRQVRNPQAAEEVTQTVFIALAQKAGRIPRQTVLCGWLFRATRYAVLHWVREEACRRRHEKEALKMETHVETHEVETVWEQISPYLNDALDGLPQRDREILMIRFFGNMSHKEVAQSLGLSEDTAKKRLSRALERLKVIFARRGVVVPAVAMVAALSAYGAQAAPTGLPASVSAAALAKAAGATATWAMPHGLSKLMLWAKTKTAMTWGTAVLLGALGTATVALNETRTPLDNVVGQLELQSGKRIAWDKHLALPAALDEKNLSLEQALDDLSVHASAYWTIDYAIYGSKQALQQLLDVLHEGAALEAAGWTNLSSKPLQANMLIGPHGLERMGGGSGTGKPRGLQDGLVSMKVFLNDDATARWEKNVRENFKRMEHGDSEVRILDTEESAIIRQAMNEGMADGVLAPERLLAEARLTPKISEATPLPATAEAADRIAKAADARWTTIYTLRKSPLEGAGIKLAHTGMENTYFHGPTNLTFGDFVQWAQTNRFNLTPDERLAHDRAVEALKRK
ncbi:MAG: sigma-70 family RNA polymerase sigma factor [Verrucomicrobiota bacterium]